MGDPKLMMIPSALRCAESKRSSPGIDSAQPTKTKAWPFQADRNGRESKPKTENTGIRPPLPPDQSIEPASIIYTIFIPFPLAFFQRLSGD